MKLKLSNVCLTMQEILSTSEVLHLHQVKALDMKSNLCTWSKLWPHVTFYTKLLEAMDLDEHYVIDKEKTL
jgi:hypothetical protein